MKKYLKITTVLLLMVLASFMLTACNEFSPEKIGEYKIPKDKDKINLKVDDFYHMEKEEIYDLESKYIKMEGKVFRILKAVEGLYYLNIVKINNENSEKDYCEIIATSYQNYFDFDFKYGDKVSVEGYVQEIHLNGNKISIYINPAIVKKA